MSPTKSASAFRPIVPCTSAGGTLTTTMAAVAGSTPNSTPSHESALRSTATGFRCCADAAVAAPEEAPLRKGQALVAEGSQLPVFEGPALGGGLTGSAALEGRVAVVNFWASWCGPCRKELPALAGLSKRNPELAVLAINVDRDVAAAERFLGGQAPPFPVLLDPQSKEAGRFDVVSMPTTFLVDPEGRVVLRHEGWSEEAFADLEAQIIALQGAGD